MFYSPKAVARAGVSEHARAGSAASGVPAQARGPVRAGLRPATAAARRLTRWRPLLAGALLAAGLVGGAGVAMAGWGYSGGHGGHHHGGFHGGFGHGGFQGGFHGRFGRGYHGRFGRGYHSGIGHGRHGGYHSGIGHGRHSGHHSGIGHGRHGAFGSRFGHAGRGAHRAPAHGFAGEDARDTHRDPAATVRADPGAGGLGRTESGASDPGGWRPLADGRYVQALTVFAGAARRAPGDGAPKVGFALSAAGSGDLGRGVWAMRRALRIDPKALAYIGVDTGVRERIAAIAADYADAGPGSAPDAAFMAAALNYLLGDLKAAAAALDRAQAGGDGSPSTGNLRDLIEDGAPSPDASAGGEAAAPAPPDGGPY